MPSTFVLIPGAGSAASLWDGVVAELARRGHDAVAVELPCDDPAAGLPAYVDASVRAVGDRRDLVVVGQSLGAFTAAALCEEVPVRLLVFLAAMIPAVGETPGDWWEHTAHADAIPDLLARHGPLSAWGSDALDDAFLAGLTADQVARSARDMRDQAGGIFGTPLTGSAWSQVPTRVLACRDDRFFPVDFVQRIARERLGLEPDVMGGGHLAMYSHAAELADRLVAYADDLPPQT